MTAIDIAPASPHFRPAAPRPRASRANTLHYLWLLWRNPIETWTERHFEQPIVIDDGPLGHVTVVSDPEGIRRVFLDKWTNYEKDPLQLKILSSGAGQGLLVARGDLWKRTRRTLAPLFTPKRIADFAPRMREIAGARAERWLKRRDGAVLDIDREMVGVTFDILSATLFSDALRGDAAGFEKAMTSYIDSIGKIDPLDVLNAPSWVPRLGRWGARSAIRFFEDRVGAMVASRQAAITRGDRPPADLMTALIEAHDPETGAGLTEDEVSANIRTFIGAGHETTARALAWTLHLISRVAAVRDRIEAEVDAAPADPASWGEALTYTRAVFEEAMRLYPPVPFMSRACLEEDVICGVTVPARTLVVVAPWVVHRHRSLWRDPDAFQPERFLPEAREGIDRFAYIPFGAGPRVCIGARFALDEGVIVLASLLSRVRLAPAGGEPMPLHRITLRPASRLAMHVHARR